MFEKVFNKPVDYFWEYDYKFGEFLKKIFPNTYQRKYSMTGNGIYNLVLVNVLWWLGAPIRRKGTDIIFGCFSLHCFSPFT